ncbi:hypothetical protein [Sphingomonas sp. G-3-2-10]|uniref:hypothetical protein n=1 Tax=Sphingomonas sp. G-3-2-10 TaxID=2728838 RepID=UPI00146DA36D|nr:hypothetical protein [Sphingomonas sp. G-3-2-10]NML06184.1 hypothetical protein [Sphingomonas sp. G-3-2-10]
MMGLFAILTPGTVAGLLLPAATVLGGLAAILFVVALLDAPTRRAVSAFNANAEARERELSWRGSLFSSRYGDMRLVIVNRVVWLEMLVFIFTGNMEAALLGFTSFALSTLMLMLMLKRQAGR